MSTSLKVDARDIARSDALKTWARWGLAARATLYLLIGWLALMISVGKKRHEADQRGALQAVAQHRGGFALLMVIFIGLAGYSLWRLSEAAFGVIGEGKGAGPRLKSLFRGVIYAVFALSTLQILLHAHVQSQASQQQALARSFMAHAYGRVAVGIVGLVVAIVGIAMVVEGVLRKFKRYFDFAAMSQRVRRIVWVLGTVGTTARGLVFVLTGVFIVRAAQTYDATKSRGLDYALRSVQSAPHGSLVLAALAGGLVCFALYGYAEAAWRRT